jgi:putative membrane protein
VVYLFKGLIAQKSKGTTSPETESALEILKKRYARGEINKEEFEEKRKDLE